MNKLGAAAEAAAADYLQGQGLKLLARNWQCRFGEIDLVMQDGATLVFVEVRQRQSAVFGGACASIGQAKQAKLIRTAQAYLQSLPAVPACRFDAICFEGEQRIWLKNCIES